MKNDYVAQFLVSAFSAVAIAVFNLALAGQINWLWVLMAFVIPFLILRAYQSSGFRVNREWRVTNDRTQLRAATGQPSGGGAWELETDEPKSWAIFGPYQPLARGKYCATFRLKINHLAGDEAVADIDVAARHGKKRLAVRSLTVKDFRHADDYQDFPLEFHLLQDENEVEFRVSTSGARRRLTLDRVILTRRFL
jgi:hypothetical protein